MDPDTPPPQDRPGRDRAAAGGARPSSDAESIGGRADRDEHLATANDRAGGEPGEWEIAEAESAEWDGGEWDDGEWIASDADEWDDGEWDDGEWDDGEWDDGEWDEGEQGRGGAVGARRPRRTLRQRGLLVVGVLATAACLVAAFGLGTVWRKWGQFERVEAAELAQVVDPEQPQNLLIVGSDSREAIDASDPNVAVFTGGEYPEGQRADSMIVLRYDPEGERLDILSIPRDLWVPIAGKDTTERINTAYSYDDGPDVLLRTIQDNLGFPIHHYAEVDFVGFQDVVDAVGGVNLYFDTIYHDAMSGFVVSEPGCMTLGGQEALAFVRSRELQYMTPSGSWETDVTADLGRISRQQYFLRQALEGTRDSLSLTRPAEMNRMLDIGIEHVRLDEGLQPTELAAMGQRFAEFQGESIETHALPVEGYTTGGGAAVLRLDEAAAQPVLNIFRGLPRDHIDVDWVELRVLNGSGERGQAGDVEQAFEAIGYSVTGVGDVPGVEGDPLERTRVRFGPGGQRLAVLVESHLTRGGELVEDPELSSSEVVVETGTDFTTVEQVPRSAAVAGSGASEPESPGSAAGDSSESSDTDEPTSGAVATSEPAVIGHVPGEPPEGVDCG